MPRQQERSALAQRRLLDAAVAVFLERGYAESSLEEVARRAGVSKGLVYHHFGSKERLLLALHEECDQRLKQRVLAADVGGPVPANLMRGMKAFVRAIADMPSARLTLLETPAVPGLREHVERDQEAWTDSIAAELQRGVRRGEIAPLDTNMAARALLGALHATALAVLASTNPRQASRGAQQALARLIAGLAPLPDQT